MLQTENMQVDTVAQFNAREERREDELQRLLKRYYEKHYAASERATRVGYYFTFVGLLVSGFLYLVRWQHLWGY